MNRVKRRQRMNWRCTCDYGCKTKAQLIAHHRREHPEDAYGLWDMCGDLGDAFANSAMKTLEEKNKNSLQRFHETEATAKAYAELTDRYTALIHAVRIGDEALQMYRDRFEKQKLQGETK